MNVAAQIARRPTHSFISPPIKPYFQQVLDSAVGMRNQGEYAVAIILAQTACEIVTEQLLDELLQLAGVTDPVHVEALGPRNTNLALEPVRKIYSALSNDHIQRQQPLWANFQAHWKRRNEIVHAGATATVLEADESLNAVVDVIEHVLNVVANLR